jgi:putative membrane protein insertion efficiency factor
MIGLGDLLRGRRRRPRRERGDGCDALDACDGCDLPGCDGCDGCDLPGCDLGLILAATVLLPVSGRARPAPTGPARAGLLAIRGYQRWVSPRLAVRCRLTPTCSRYGAAAVRRYGLAVGTRLAAERIAECGRVARAERTCDLSRTVIGASTPPGSATRAI